MYVDENIEKDENQVQPEVFIDMKNLSNAVISVLNHGLLPQIEAATRISPA